MIVALKIIHIMALSVWCVGLLALPALLASRGRAVEPTEKEVLNRRVRWLFNEVTSPAALIAIASGIALIFQRGFYSDWLYAKLAAVSLLVFVHLRAGRLVSASLRPYGSGRQAASIMVTLSIVSMVFWLVLAKPAFDVSILPGWMSRPGALQSLLEIIRPIP